MTGLAVANELFTTTIALESALKADQFDEAPALLEKRDAILDRLECFDFEESWRPVLNSVKQIDERISRQLHDLRSHAATELTRQSKAKTQLNTYHLRASAASAFDHSS